MSTWSEGLAVGTGCATVLRGDAARIARPARIDSELRSTPFAGGRVVDARLTDPHLQSVVEQAHRTASVEGHAAGFAEGYAAGLSAAAVEAAARAEQAEQQRRAAGAAAAEQVDEALDVLGTMGRALADQDRLAIAEVEDVISDVALRVARAVLDRELELSADPGAEAIARALALAPEDCSAVIRLHPHDAAVIRDLSSLTAGRSVALVADPDVARGGCVVEGAGRRIDAQIETALSRVAAVLR
jgi:flagellar assembly protein FliH